MKPAYESRKTKASLFGFASGLDFYYKYNRFINLSGSFSTVGDIYFGCGFVEEDEERFNVYSISISNNHRNKWYSYGYGIVYNYIDYWNIKYNESPLADYKFSYTHDDKKHEGYHYRDRRYSTMGLLLNGYLYFSNNFYIGVIYKPTFVHLKPIAGKAFKYEHQISLDVAFKIRLNKRK